MLARAATRAAMARSTSGQRVVARVVEDDGDELADGVQAVCRECPGLVSGSVGQEAVRSELRCGQADLAHLGEHGRRVQLVSPVPDLAHPPGDGSAGDPLGEWEGHGVRLP